MKKTKIPVPIIVFVALLIVFVIILLALVMPTFTNLSKYNDDHATITAKNCRLRRCTCKSDKCRNQN